MVYRMVFHVDGAVAAMGSPALLELQPLRYGSRIKTQHLPSHYITPTNQRAELTAIIMALEWALEIDQELAISSRLDVKIHSDSKYAVNCMNEWLYKWLQNGWVTAAGYDVVNRDLIQTASDLEDRLRELGSVNFIWVPREQNVDADEYCNRALNEQCY
ncbi:ribonuclease H-like domain-containing protein [Astrocystis sublimbata]|nr:ribonuclease H-like domain-containing protein [Astrocystis sublimbata]